MQRAAKQHLSLSCRQLNAVARGSSALALDGQAQLAPQPTWQQVVGHPKHPEKALAHLNHFHCSNGCLSGFDTFLRGRSQETQNSPRRAQLTCPQWAALPACQGEGGGGSVLAGLEAHYSLQGTRLALEPVCTLIGAPESTACQLT